VHNPFGKGDLPIWVASYVVAEYGTGVVNCSAHDERDFAFAKKYGIPLRTAMLPKDKEQAKKVENLEFCYHHADDGIIQEPVEFKGMTWKDSREPIIKYIEKKKIGRVAVHYKIRDWMVSRQRYWGTPIPMVHCPKCGVVPVPGKELPVLLPQDVDFKAAGNPLASCKSFVEVRCPKCKGPAKRETDTMGGFMDSSWYFLRYCSPKEKEFAFDKKAVNYWMPVDQYIGGAEHAVMHLLYARFFIKALKDMGLVSFDEPFSKLFNQGILYKDGHKMSKSFGNVVTQEEISKKYGIDTARIFLMFVSSPESQMEWSDEGIVGAARFVQRFWTLVNEAKKCKTRSGKLGTRDLMMRARLHSSVKSVTETVEGFKFNLTIGKLMELTNELQKYMEDAHKDILNDSVGTLIAMLSPFAPHICEEAWELTGNKKLVSLAGWPECNEDFIDRKLEMMGELVEDSKDDIREVLKIVGKEPKAINIYVSPLWKYTVYNEILDKAKGEAQIKDMLKHVMQMPEARQQGKHAVSFAERLARDARMLGGVLSQDDEEKALSEASQELEKLFNCKVKVMKAEASKSPKALRAEPGKPGIEIE
jgi:leucyl-tRNA synthetase